MTYSFMRKSFSVDINPNTVPALTPVFQNPHSSGFSGIVDFD